METKIRVLFLSTGNSTRSQMAQGFLSALAEGRLRALSAGVKPGGLDPLAAEVMTEAGIEILGQESIEVAQALKIHFGYVITLYDAAKERSPIFPFTFNILRWSIPDPVTVNGTPAERKNAFRGARDQIHSHVQDFLTETLEREPARGILAA
jgi:protein-tyrosine-phosphatase